MRACLRMTVAAFAAAMALAALAGATGCGRSEAPSPSVQAREVRQVREGDESPAASREVVVAWCYDGDSFRTSTNEDVRVLGIDTPEKGRPLADKARRLAVKTLKGRRVRLAADGARFATDRYGRTLAYVDVDGRDYGQTVLAAGLARVYRHAQCGRQTEYSRTEQAARRERVGIWR